MSHKTAQDKQLPAYPWTARQRRRLLGFRKARKLRRHGHKI